MASTALGTFDPPGIEVKVGDYFPSRQGELLFTFKHTDKVTKPEGGSHLYRAWFRQPDGSFVEQPLMTWLQIIDQHPKPETLWPGEKPVGKARWTGKS